jgi:uncharacterized integral membrane protein
LFGFFIPRMGEDKAMSSNTPASATPDVPPTPPKAPPPPPPVGPISGSAEPAVKFTRAGALWTALFVGFLVLIVLLIFVAQNIDSVPLHLFGWSWSVPLGIAILLAAVGGGLLTVAVGTARILQLRRVAKKHHTASIQ